MPASSLADDGPVYDRPAAAPAAGDGRRRRPTFALFEKDLTDAVLTVLTAPNVASKRWAFEQYDRMVQGQTVVGPDSDAAVVRVAGSLQGLRSLDGRQGRFGRLDPFLGRRSRRRRVGPKRRRHGRGPIAITNCLNFGNPERPEVMWQLAESIRGMREACLALTRP